MKNTQDIKNLKEAIECIEKFQECISNLSEEVYLEAVERLDLPNLANLEQTVEDITGEINSVIEFVENKVDEDYRDEE